METYGADGGDTTTYHGGYGGYSIGVMKINKRDVLYIVVGGAGIDNPNYVVVQGGYNGGGASGINPGGAWYGGSGGGATHIATKTGLLSTLENAKSSILIVSGAGAGGGYATKANCSGGNGGNGGGIQGSTGSGKTEHCGFSAESWYGPGGGGSQTGAGTFVTTSSCGESSFGQAGSDPACGHAGGGSGFFAGAPGFGGSGGGGSGYIGSSSLVSGAGVAKHMYGYNVPTSNDANTRTITGTCANTTPTADCAKIGNGYARITWLGDKI